MTTNYFKIPRNILDKNPDGTYKYLYIFEDGSMSNLNLVRRSIGKQAYLRTNMGEDWYDLVVKNFENMLTCYKLQLKAKQGGTSRIKTYEYYPDYIISVKTLNFLYEKQ